VPADTLTIYANTSLSNNVILADNGAFNTFTNNIPSTFNHNVVFNSNVSISTVDGGQFTVDDILIENSMRVDGVSTLNGTMNVVNANLNVTGSGITTLS
jgi:hypothetical protein